MSEQNPILDALALSLLVNRKDQPGQSFWTEWRTGLVLTGGTPAQAGDLAILGPNGQFDPSVIPGGSGGSTVFVNGVPVTDPNFNNSTPAAPAGFANIVWQTDGSGNISAYYATGGGSSDITVFPDDTPSDIPSYGILTEDPSTIEQIGTATVNTNGVNVPFSPENSFASPGNHGVDVIPAGTWIFDTWVSVNTTGGNAATAVFIAVYARDTGGFETLLFSVQTPTITSTTPQLFEVSFNGSDYFINNTDRIVVKYFGVRTSGNQTRTVSFYHAGETHLSRITAPIPTVTFVPFNAISSGTNTQATMTVDTGASIVVTGSGVVEATELATPSAPVNISGNAPTHEGMLLISQPGNTTAVWADPLVQGLYPAGSSVASPPPFAPPTTIQPVLVGGEGTSPSGQDGLLHPLPLSANGGSVLTLENQQEAKNSGGTDPYSRDRVSSPITLFEESYQFFPVGPLTTPPEPTQFQFLTSGSGAFQRPSGFAYILGTVGTDSGARAVWQTKSYWISQLGKGFGIMTTGNLGVNIANVITRIGAYDDDHGGFFEQNGVTGTLRVVFRTNGVDTGVNQANWNIDKLDGTGPSGVTLNMAFAQSFTIDVGAGRIRFGFTINGVVYYCQSINLANAVLNIVNSQSIVPVRFEILNAGASAGGSIWQSNLVVFSESGFEDDPTAFAFSVNTGTTLRSVTMGVPTPIISIRPALLLNGHPNREFITLRDYGVFSLGQVVQYELIYNGTLTGASFASANPVSGVEYDLAATTITGGRVVDSGFIAAFAKDTTFAADTFPFRLPFTIDITGSVQDIYTLVVTAISGTAQVGGSFKWQEQR